MFDDDRPVIARPVETGEDDTPVDLAQARHARNLPAHAGRENATLIEAIPVDHQVLGMDMKHMRSEFADETRLVYHLQHQMRGIEIHAHSTFPCLEDAPPYIGRIGDI